MVHSPMLQLSVAQSSFTWQLQKPNDEPSRKMHWPAHDPVGWPTSFTQVPPRWQSVSEAQGREGSPGHACEALHCHLVNTTRMSRQP